MELNEYQERAMETCMPESNNFAYMILNLMGEIGEFSGKVAKAIRGGGLYIPDVQLRSTNKLQPENMSKLSNELKKEAGDILWQLAGLCHVLNWDLEEIAAINLHKLAHRKKHGKIDGDGDHR